MAKFWVKNAFFSKSLNKQVEVGDEFTPENAEQGDELVKRGLLSTSKVAKPEKPPAPEAAANEDDREAELDRREAALQERERALDVPADKRHQARTDALDAREDELNQRESALNAREDALTAPPGGQGGDKMGGDGNAHVDAARSTGDLNQRDPLNPANQGGGKNKNK